jgi:hypothetical protein
MPLHSRMTSYNCDLMLQPHSKLYQVDLEVLNVKSHQKITKIFLLYLITIKILSDALARQVRSIKSCQKPYNK